MKRQNFYKNIGLITLASLFVIGLGASPVSCGGSDDSSDSTSNNSNNSGGGGSNSGGGNNGGGGGGSSGLTTNDLSTATGGSQVTYTANCVNTSTGPLATYGIASYQDEITFTLYSGEGWWTFIRTWFGDTNCNENAATVPQLTVTSGGTYTVGSAISGSSMYNITFVNMPFSYGSMEIYDTTSSFTAYMQGGSGDADCNNLSWGTAYGNPAVANMPNSGTTCSGWGWNFPASSQDVLNSVSLSGTTLTLGAFSTTDFGPGIWSGTPSTSNTVTFTVQ